MTRLARLLAEHDASERAITAYEAEVRHWISRLDKFCGELEQLGFGVQRDGLTVVITAPATGSDAT